MRGKRAAGLLTSHTHFIPAGLALMCPFGLGAVRPPGAVERPTRIVTTAGALIMSDLADRLTELERRITELRDFL